MYLVRIDAQSCEQHLKYMFLYLVCSQRSHTRTRSISSKTNDNNYFRTNKQCVFVTTKSRFLVRRVRERQAKYKPQNNNIFHVSSMYKHYKDSYNHTYAVSEKRKTKHEVVQVNKHITVRYTRTHALYAR